MTDLLDTAAPDVLRPNYDRSALRAGIAHIGVGGFHRAHQAVAIDRLLNQGLAFDWAICGVGLLPGDKRMQEVLQAQDCLYTLVEKAPDGTQSARIIGSIIDYVFVPDDPDAAIERLADPRIRIVSLTVTEGGYNISPVTGSFDLADPHVEEDLASAAAPRTTFGLVTEALRRRRDRGIAPFTVMSCDNIQDNGSVAKTAFVTFARAKDPDLGDWIEQQVSFPSSMVDRITPVTTEEDRSEITQQYGVADGWPVVAEPFFQWVVEDSFVSGRPPLEQAGVQVVKHVEPYELMKLRLLNAGHQALAYFGHLSGYRYAHDAARDPVFARFLLRYMHQEAMPTLRPVPGVDLDRYTAQLIERFSNAAIKDTIARLCADSSNRIPKWLVPVIRENLQAGRPVPLSAAIVASWARYAEGRDEQGQPIEIVDARAEERMAAAQRQAEDPLAFVRDPDLFGSLAEEPAFTQPYLAALESLHRRGAHATLVDLAGD